jgi:3-hydroxybutyryl-CoA dehydrogenase
LGHLNATIQRSCVSAVPAVYLLEEKMNEHTQQKIGVVGGGLMGHGIAYLFAAAGHHVNVFEPFSDMRNSLPRRLLAIIELLGDDPRLLTRIAAHDSLEIAMGGADWVFEAAPEKLPVKQEIFAAIEKLVAPSTILASNSSAIPSTEIGRHLKNRERMIGTHFWNPPHLVPLVEVIQNEKTGSEVVERTMRLLRQAGKVPVHVRRDIPGFVGNRLQHAMKREAIALVAAGVCDAQTIDTVVREGFGARTAVLGPMEQGTWSASTFSSTSRRCSMTTLTAPRGRTRSCATRSRPASSA